MIGLDTKLLLPYITNDDPEQSARAVQIVEALSEESPGYLKRSWGFHFRLKRLGTGRSSHPVFLHGN